MEAERGLGLWTYLFSGEKKKRRGAKNKNDVNSSTVVVT